ncbi:hypothetical protein GGS24DRAFT_411578 [Hypoxylon argillaceum]|nr:hypothetical protein GGS24DRAFT_411578 [Hypoxylon argillaceum]
MAAGLGTDVIIISVVFSTLAIVAVLLRLRARVLQHAKLGPDDYLIVPGMIFAVGFGANNIAAVVVGHLGSHVPVDANGVPETGPYLIKFKETLFVATLLPILSHFFTKSSILFLYRRILRGNTLSYVTSGLLIAVWSWGIAFFFASLFTCYPINQNWLSLHGSPEHNAHCYNYIPMYYATAISNVILDVLILLVPIPIVWRLHMPTKRKIGVIGIFLLGGLVVGIGAARVYFFFRTGIGIKEYDVTYNQAAVQYWSFLESSIAVVCACLPTLPILVTRISIERVLRSFRSMASLASHHSSTKDHLPQTAGDQTSMKGLTHAVELDFLSKDPSQTGKGSVSVDEHLHEDLR